MNFEEQMKIWQDKLDYQEQYIIMMNIFNDVNEEFANIKNPIKRWIISRFYSKYMWRFFDETRPFREKRKEQDQIDRIEKVFHNG